MYKVILRASDTRCKRLAVLNGGPKRGHLAVLGHVYRVGDHWLSQWHATAYDGRTLGSHADRHAAAKAVAAYAWERRERFARNRKAAA